MASHFSHGGGGEGGEEDHSLGHGLLGGRQSDDDLLNLSERDRQSDARHLLVAAIRDLAKKPYNANSSAARKTAEKRKRGDSLRNTREETNGRRETADKNERGFVITTDGRGNPTPNDRGVERSGTGGAAAVAGLNFSGNHTQLRQGRERVVVHSRNYHPPSSRQTRQCQCHGQAASCEGLRDVELGVSFVGEYAGFDLIWSQREPCECAVTSQPCSLFCGCLTSQTCRNVPLQCSCHEHCLPGRCPCVCAGVKCSESCQHAGAASCCSNPFNVVGVEWQELSICQWGPLALAQQANDRQLGKAILEQNITTPCCAQKFPAVRFLGKEGYSCGCGQRYVCRLCSGTPTLHTPEEGDRLGNFHCRMCGVCREGVYHCVGCGACSVRGKATDHCTACGMSPAFLEGTHTLLVEQRKQLFLSSQSSNITAKFIFHNKYSRKVLPITEQVIAEAIRIVNSRIATLEDNLLKLEAAAHQHGHG
mmetsp:Transcript_7353/g.20927  ORF Transcript_7353/g.20927 Transcript_7353/m.20927 type:complete len:478 (-) Transcript_7353:158-1591(-)